ncbi:MAG TPA: hypothetical protein ENN29_13480 [Candidatus Hydrogenedentes bacterium]|nr:hypothetical protein [Candidatus Hydrogenedentota bacterium]
MDKKASDHPDPLELKQCVELALPDAPKWLQSMYRITALYHAMPKDVADWYLNLQSHIPELALKPISQEILPCEVSPAQPEKDSYTLKIFAFHARGGSCPLFVRLPDYVFWCKTMWFPVADEIRGLVEDPPDNWNEDPRHDFRSGGIYLCDAVERVFGRLATRTPSEILHGLSKEEPEWLGPIHHISGGIGATRSQRNKEWLFRIWRSDAYEQAEKAVNAGIINGKKEPVFVKNSEYVVNSLEFLAWAYDLGVPLEERFIKILQDRNMLNEAKTLLGNSKAKNTRREPKKRGHPRIWIGWEPEAFAIELRMLEKDEPIENRSILNQLSHETVQQHSLDVKAIRDMRGRQRKFAQDKAKEFISEYVKSAGWTDEKSNAQTTEFISDISTSRSWRAYLNGGWRLNLPGEKGDWTYLKDIVDHEIRRKNNALRREVAQHDNRTRKK